MGFVHNNPNWLGRRRNRRFLLQSSDGFAERKSFLLLAAEPPQRNRTVGRLASADNQHDGHFGEAVFADLVVDLLVAGVEDDPEPGSATFPGDLAGVIRRLRSDRGDDDLHRSEPKRKAAGVMLDQHANEALERAEDRPMQHYRAMPPPVFADIA